jgi:hypothetical protein
MRFQPEGDTEFQLDRILNNGIEFADNMRGSLIEVTLSGETRVTHGLGYTPMGFLVIFKDGEGDVWAARPRDWNSQTLYLASSATSLKVRLFVV